MVVPIFMCVDSRRILFNHYQEADLPIIAMYPDVKNSERVNVYVFRFEDDI